MHLAFDLGATSWRAMLGGHCPGENRLEEIVRSENRPIQIAQGLFWNVEKIFSDIKQVLRQLIDRGVRLDSIGMDSWNVDYALLDESGRMLESPRCYRDPRNTGMADSLSSMIDLDEVFQRTGSMAEDITTLCQLLAAKRDTPKLLSRAKRLLFIPDLLRYWLCGQIATDYTLASTSQLYDSAGAQWDTELMDRLSLPWEILPPVRYGCSILGRLSESLQRETGQGAVPVTTGASHDTAAAFFAANADDDSVIISSGTWSIIGVNMPSPLPHGRVNPKEFGYEGNVDGTIRLIQNVPGMYLLEQCRQEWQTAPLQKNLTAEALVTQASACTDFSTSLDPFWPGFQNPSSMIQAVIQYCQQTNQPAPKQPGEYARAIVQGLAAHYAKVIRQLRTMTNRPLGTLVMIGGGSQNTLLNNMTAEAAKITVIRGPVEASAAGNIRCQKIALAR